MDTPYYVTDHSRRVDRYGNYKTEYALKSVGDGPLVFSTDLVLLHKIADLLNEDVHATDVHR